MCSGGLRRAGIGHDTHIGAPSTAANAVPSTQQSVDTPQSTILGAATSACSAGTHLENVWLAILVRPSKDR